MKKFKVVFFFLLMIPGWWCENDQSSTSQKSSTLGSQNSSTSGPQNSKNAVLQAQEDHFEFIFNKVKRILIKFKKQSLPSVFDEKKPLKGEYDVFHAYCCSKIGNQQIHQKIRNWIYKTNNKEKFLSYFTALASDLTKNQFSKFSRQPFLIIFFFDLALSFDLEDEKISGFFESLIKKEEREILLLKLIPVLCALFAFNVWLSVSSSFVNINPFVKLLLLYSWILIDGVIRIELNESSFQSSLRLAL